MSRHSQARSASRLQERLDSLNTARELAAGVLADAQLEAVYEVLDRAASRRSLSAGHTVVGFFGATGSGKSSLFNAVSGSNLATAAARRPTTSAPLAAVWGEEGSGPLLDWLDVRERHALPEVADFAGGEAGLILLDLPDIDSTTVENRQLVERLAGMVDVLVWVLDPQKYADAAVHHGFLRPMATHGAVTLVVLNQMDRLNAADADAVVASLRGILDQDGLGGVPVFGTSAVTGDGVAAVRGAIRNVVVQREAATQRLSADVARAASGLAEASGDGEARGVSSQAKAHLIAELATAANVPLVVDAVERSFMRQSARRTGWPVTRWLLRFRPDPLRRLNLGRTDANPELNRTSLPPAGAPERARTDAAVRSFVDDASAGAPGPWRAAIRGVARDGREQLPDALDQAIAVTDLKASKRPFWWGLFNGFQWLALLLAIGGLAWLGVVAALGYFQLPVPEVPRTEGWPWPTLLVAGGAVLGVILALGGRLLGAGAARVRARGAARRLKAAVGLVATERIVEPVEVEVTRLSAFNAALKAARGG
ncbi:GTPase [Paenarthrobacter sp. NPDC089989]|uniref:GTPase n=1 Tax=unclassified Paenarthrobacter TaxID=2634190 RepID=UPI0038024699